MSLIAIEGFDHYSSYLDLQYRIGAIRWAYSQYDPGFSNYPKFVTGRGGYGKALSIGETNGNILNAVLGSNYASGIVGLACITLVQSIFVSSFFNQWNLVIWDYATTLPTIQFIVSFYNHTGVIKVFAADRVTVLASTLNDAYNPAAWQYIEVKVVIGTTTGQVAIQVGNQSVLTATNINTQNSSNASFSGFGIEIPVGAYSFTHDGSQYLIDIDDIYFLDGTTGPGAYPYNTFLGDVRVATLFPASNGSVSWTPLANTNWQEVSETAFDGDVSYNYSSTVNQEDLFNLTSLTGTLNTVLAVQVTGAYRKTDSSNRTMYQHISQGGTDTPGSLHTLSMSYQFFTDIFPINPGSGANWTASQINSLEIGYVLIS